ncbi:replication protein A 70 kDa DNA-binding subunit A [Tanacetum coccineum]
MEDMEVQRVLVVLEIQPPLVEIEDNRDDVWVIFVLNMEIVILECEIIRNPHEFLPSNPVSNGVSQQTTMPSFNRSSVTNMSSNTQTFRPTIQPAYQPPPIYKIHGLIMRNEAPARIIMISTLNPYQDGGKIRMTCFNAQHGNVIAATKILRNATTFQDHTGLTWVTDFQEAGEEVLGCSTKELYLKSQVHDDERFSNADKSHLFAELVMVAIERSPVNCASLSMLPWPKPTIWPSDASSEVLAKEKVYY